MPKWTWCGCFLWFFFFSPPFASLFTLCLPGVSAQLLNGFALSATVQSPVRLFKKALAAPLPSSERDWEGDSQRVPTNKKPGGIRVRIVLRVPAAQTSKLQGSTLAFVPWAVEFLGASLHPSHRVSCTFFFFNSLPFSLFKQRGLTKHTASFCKLPRWACMLRFAGFDFFFCSGEYNKERWVYSFDGESCLVKRARRIVWIFPCSYLGGRVAICKLQLLRGERKIELNTWRILQQFLKIFSFKNTTAARCPFSK